MLKSKFVLAIVAVLATSGIAYAVVPGLLSGSTFTATLGGTEGCSASLGPSALGHGLAVSLDSSTFPRAGGMVCLQVELLNTGTSPESLPGMVRMTVSGTGSNQTFVFPTAQWPPLEPGKSWTGNVIWNTATANPGLYYVKIEAGNLTASWALSLG